MKSVSKAAGGFIPLGAAATLIGSSTAESLVLGDRGASGLPWATLSFFGTLSVVKACIAAVSPECIRDAIGVRSQDVDSAMGRSMGLASTPPSTCPTGRPAGVTCEIRPGFSNMTPLEHGRAVYTFDHETLNCLNALPELDSGKALRIYTYSDDPWTRDRFKKSLWWDSTALFMSLIKIVEIVVLWRRGARQLGWVTGLSWGSFFVGAFLLQIVWVATFTIGGDRRLKADILAGELPSLYKRGGSRKILLGLPRRFIFHYAWKLVWIFGGVAALASVIATWLLLESQDQEVIYIWVAFQVIWLAARSIFFYVSQSREITSRHPLILGSQWQSMDHESKARVRNLIFVLSKSEMNLHSRGSHSYKEDAVTISEWKGTETSFQIGSAANDTQHNIRITGIIGDTLLYSTCWILGSELSAMDLHDSCIVTLKTREREVSVPAVRALSVIPGAGRDAEPMKKTYPPEGGANSGINIMWWYWIPCGDNLWLEVKSTDMKILGRRTARVVHDQDVNSSLRGPDIRISMQDVREITARAERSREAANILGVFLN